MVFSAVDSLNKAMLKLEGANVPAAKYSFVWSGQNAMEDTIPISKFVDDNVCRETREVGGGCSDLSRSP
jgi:hypothetical protein